MSKNFIRLFHTTLPHHSSSIDHGRNDEIDEDERVDMMSVNPYNWRFFRDL